MGIKLSRLNPDILGGLALLLAAISALLFVNLGGAQLYHHTLELPLTLGLTKSLHHWITDGLMVLFFVLVGIEIQREVHSGSLQKPRQAILPLAAALGGFVAPALVFLAFTAGTEAAHGWSIPAATDIAFAVALITVLKPYVPASLRAFLLALAVADDLLAILVIALFYTADVVWMNLFLAGIAALALLAKRRLHVQSLWVYIALGLFMWLCVLQSGVHATVAGVLLGLLLPLKGTRNQPAPADMVEHALQPIVRWLILPLFAFASIGVDLTALTAQSLLTPLTLAITLGLFLGKQIGVFGTVWALVTFAKLPRPASATWRHVYGVACACGIGFTMSLFIGALALAPEHQAEVRLGVLAGSILSALAAVLVLKRSR